MSLLEEIEKDKAALKALEEAETQVEETEEQEEDIEAQAEEDKPEAEEDLEDGDSEEKSEEEQPEEKPDNSAFARLRREKAAAEKRARELEEQLNRPKEQVGNEVKAPNTEPDINEDPIEWLKWNNQRIDRLEKQLAEKQKAEEETQIYSTAKNEFMAIEQDFARTADDYNDVSAFLAQKISDSIRTLNPTITPQELQSKVENQILVTASRYYQQGLNPVEEMYYLAKEQLGYQPKATEAKTEEVKPDIRKVAQNRKRNAGTAAASGSGGSPQITREVAANMTTAEFSRLSAAERQRLLSGQ